MNNFLDLSTPQAAPLNSPNQTAIAADSNSRKIMILAQPRSKYRPRTEAESRTSAHYIRCDEGGGFSYPTIALNPDWNNESKKNIIEVALLDIQRNAHPYQLVNKHSTDELSEDHQIAHCPQKNALYFLLTPKDFENAYKSFVMELIKTRQNDVMTRELIRERQLQHSFLRFTRVFVNESGLYTRDVSSVAVSNQMTESYGEVTIEDFGPTYGYSSEDCRVIVVFKGRVFKDHIGVYWDLPSSGGTHQIENFVLTGNTIQINLPRLDDSHNLRLLTNIRIFYENQFIKSLPFCCLPKARSPINSLGSIESL